MLPRCVFERSRALVTAVTLLSACADAARDAQDATQTAAADAAPRADAGLDAAATADAARDRDARAGEAGADDAGVDIEVGADYLRWPALFVPSDGELTLAFDVPSDARSFVWTLDPGAAPRDIELHAVTGPEGSELFALDTGDAAADAGSLPRFDPASAVNVDESLPYTLMLPSAPEVSFAPGRYRIRVGVTPARADSNPALAADLVWQRSQAIAPSRLSLVLWFAPEIGLDARAAQRDDQLQTALAIVREIYAGAEIELASIAYRDLAGDAAPALSVLDDSAELAELFDRIAEQGAHDRALDIAFVEHLEVGPGKIVRGKTSGLPVPPAHPQLSRRGGVVVPLDTLPDEPGRIAELIAHEIGHALGLRHTTEYDGERHDPIADTAACPAERATSISSTGDPIVSAEDCADLDGSNLLFYTPPLTDTPQRDLTGGQVFVLQRSPLVR